MNAWTRRAGVAAFRILGLVADCANAAIFLSHVERHLFMVTDHLVVFGDGAEFYLRHDVNELIISCPKSAE